MDCECGSKWVMVCPHCHQYTQSFLWINCSARLPKRSGSYLVFARCDQHLNQPPLIRVSFYIISLGWQEDFNDVNPITHWMELPEEPTIDE